VKSFGSFPLSFRYRINPATEKYREPDEETDWMGVIIPLFLVGASVLVILWGFR